MSFVKNYNQELYHYGVKGMKWGVRRYQNADGSLTDLGKRKAINREAKQYRKELYKKFEFTRKLAKEESDNWKKGQLEDAGLKYKGLTDKQKKAIKVGAAVAATALVAYGGYKLYDSGKLDVFINKGFSKTNELLKMSGDIKTVKVNKVNIDRVPIKTDRIRVQDLSAGNKLLQNMKKNGTNITRELSNNQWMSEDIGKLAKSIETVKKVNAAKKSYGIPVDESVLAKMELAYLVKRRAESQK